MSANSKPRGDSKLKILPPDRQSEVFEHGTQHKLDETVAWLRADGCKVSRTTLSEFLSWYGLRQQLNRNESTVETLLENLPKQGMTPGQIQEIGQAFFTALALQQQDPKQWFLAQQLALKKQQLQFDQEKFQASLRSKIETALAALAAEVKGNAKAEAALREVFTALETK